MAGFTAADAVPRLDFDLAPHGPAGIIPEPSTGQVEKLQNALADLAGTDAKSPTDALAHVASLSDEDQQKIVDDLMGSIADITATVLTREQIEALPYRIQRAFVAWLMASLLLPEGQSPATTT
jgi:hypothetical protein